MNYEEIQITMKISLFILAENARMRSNGYFILEICFLALYTSVVDGSKDDFRYIPFQGKGHHDGVPSKVPINLFINITQRQ